MHPLQTLLMAVDFRPSRGEVSRVTSLLTRAFGCRLVLLHIASDATKYPARDQSQRQFGREMLATVIEEFAREQISVEQSEVVSGPVAETILRKADDAPAGLIIMGAGEPDAEGLVTPGPITETVMQHAHQSVLAVRAGTPPLEFRSILCPIDGSETSLNGLKYAIPLARAFHSQLTVLTVVPEMSWLMAAGEAGTLVDVQKEYAANWVQECAQAVSKVDFQGVSWTQDVRHGAPDKEIVAAANEAGCDLIVMGATGRSGIVRLMMGSTSRRVLRRLPCSMLVVHGHA
ncbi:MAG: universal stress protein [Planctomycetaceae bacterium]|nr:universal stress protein [Planctomycetaceae bacterium]